MSETSLSGPAGQLRGHGFRGRLEPECALAPHTTWRIGGPAQLLATPEDADDLKLAVGWAEAARMPWRVLGNGSNLLVRDRGIRGLVLRIRKVLSRVERDECRLVAGAGASLPAVARQAAACGLSGLEFGAGIPGTLGGAVVMNAGWHEHEIGNVVDWVDWLEPDGGVRRVEQAECEFGYRRSLFRGRRGVVLAAGLSLRPGDAVEISARLEHYAASRKANQPTELPSCGSVFLKPPGDFAGRLIEKAGLKGARSGDVQVSPRHANFFVNLGDGNSDDALSLIDRVEREVESRFGVKLTREFELW